MKKGVIALVVILALVVVVSPGIIGKLAEQSVDENLNRAADQSGELVVTSTGFDGGWFSSEGEHRVAIGEGNLREAVTLARGMGNEALPVLIINTRMDHGIIPVTSMSREKGSLAPGLGSAISTLRLEFGDGETVDVPGTIYSNVALDGDLASRYLVDAGSRDVEDGTVEWQPATISVVADSGGKGYELEGDIAGLTLTEASSTMSVGPVRFDGEQSMTKHGFFVGDVDFNLGAVEMSVNGVDALRVAGASIAARNSLDGDRVVGDMTMSLNEMSVPNFGDVSYQVTLESTADAAAFGRFFAALDAMSGDEDPSQVMASVESEAKDLVAAGLDLNFSRFDVTLPMGTVETVFAFSTPEQDRAAFEWTSLLLKGKASLDLKVPAALVQLATSMSPEAGMLIAAGYLRKDGDFYVMDADMESGLLTVNGAPIPIPMGMF